MNQMNFCKLKRYEESIFLFCLFNWLLKSPTLHVVIDYLSGWMNNHFKTPQ